ncbi:MAG: hypothetical protein HRU23_19100 [Gammaproteobacteria bacterium]|nr:hypothetical protein [Psychrosphaera sp.]NRA56255.1 hypothetical protein [Gammaproteobacteria bacterium]
MNPFVYGTGCFALGLIAIVLILAGMVITPWSYRNWPFCKLDLVAGLGLMAAGLWLCKFLLMI